MKKRSTLIDVARLAKVGTSTVSRFLRGVPIRSEAAAVIAAAIAELDYTPDETARALRGGSAQTIGVLVPQVDNTFFSKAIQAIQLEAHERGFTIILLLHEEDAERQLRHLATLRRYRADGVILAAASGLKANELTGALGDTPVVAFDRALWEELDAVTLQNRESARAATDHLIRHKYKNITCVTAKSDLSTFRERIVGYTEAMQAAELTPHLLAAPNYHELRLALAALLTSGKSDALLSLSNMATNSLLFASNDLGLPPERRLPFLGFDDFDFAPLMSPSLSVVRQPVELMVRYTFDFLMRRIQQSQGKAAASPTQRIALAGELICRRSCGCG